VPGNIVKYDGKTNPSVWLEDYHLACRVGGANDDHFIIQFLPIYLAYSARAWLDNLPRNVIDNWDDLREILTGNFQGTYMHPGNSWDLKGCQQKPGESLWNYIRCFSQKCNELPSVADTDVILVFWDGTTYRTLVHELRCEQPKTTKVLLDVATQHASGEEAVGATFVLGNARGGDQWWPGSTH
jgi:hypothetical protein